MVKGQIEHRVVGGGEDFLYKGVVKKVGELIEIDMWGDQHL